MLPQPEKDPNAAKKAIKIRTKVNSKTKGKIKPIMVDAWTQTERSDFAIIKYKMQKKLQEKQSLESSNPISTTGYEKSKMNMLLNSQTDQKPGHRTVLRSDSLGPHKTMSLKSSITPHSATKAKELVKEMRKITQSGKKSQLTLGFSKNTIKSNTKRSLLKSNNHKRSKKMRLPSIQASRDAKNEDLKQANIGSMLGSS